MPLTVLITGAGKVKEPFLRDGIQEYKKRLSGYVKISLEEVPDESIPQNMSEQVKHRILDTEGENILKKLKTTISSFFSTLKAISGIRRGLQAF